MTLDNSERLGPATADIVGAIHEAGGARRPRAGAWLAREVLAGRVTPEGVDAIAAALTARREPQPPLWVAEEEPPVDHMPPADPYGQLPTIPPPRWASWGEYSQPNGDKD